MLQALLAGLLTAGAMTSFVMLNEVLSPQQTLLRLTPVVVGTLDLTSSPGAATFDVANMAPGDEVTSGLSITNGGTLPFRYAMRTSVDDDGAGLDAVLVVSVREAVDGSCADPGGVALVAPTDPAQVAFGSAAWGEQVGDRRLDPGESELLCFDVALPISVTNAVAGASATLNFVFDAEEIRAE